jgi:hypothetical protein
MLRLDQLNQAINRCFLGQVFSFLVLDSYLNQHLIN